MPNALIASRETLLLPATDWYPPDLHDRIRVRAKGDPSAVGRPRGFIFIRWRLCERLRSARRYIQSE